MIHDQIPAAHSFFGQVFHQEGSKPFDAAQNPFSLGKSGQTPSRFANTYVNRGVWVSVPVAASRSGEQM
ncbi:MAG: hypothetical protein GEU91_06880 [Rhizobiales bacterium]|nr:hypothetical protein [Hyphomicrobiales bacterium]